MALDIPLKTAFTVFVRLGGGLIVKKKKNV